MYELRNVTKNYLNGRRTVTAVRDLNLVIGDGEWLAIQGRTGHGKSTLLHILGALDGQPFAVADDQVQVAHRGDGAPAVQVVLGDVAQLVHEPCHLTRPWPGRRPGAAG